MSKEINLSEHILLLWLLFYSYIYIYLFIYIQYQNLERITGACNHRALC